MKLARRKNAYKGIIFGVINKVITLSSPFIMRTIIIKKLGSEYLGLSSLFSSILNTLNLAELGIGSVIVFSMYKPIAEDNIKKLNALLNYYKKIYKFIGLIILVIGIFLIPFLRYFIKESNTININIYILYIIYLLNTVISYIFLAYKASVLYAYQRVDVESNINTIFNILMYALQILILLTLNNYYLFVIMFPITTFIINIYRSKVVKHMYPNINNIGSLENDEIKIIRKNTLSIMGHKIGGTIISSVDNIIISTILGLTILTVYNNYYYILTTITAIITIIYKSISAGIGNSLVTESKEENYYLFKKFIFINTWLTGWCSICLFCLYQNFIIIWVGEKYLLPFSTVILLVIYFYILRIHSNVNVFKESAGLWWNDRYVPYIGAIINLTVSIILVKKYGINGVLVGSIISVGFVILPTGAYIVFEKYFNKSLNKYFMSLINDTIVILFNCIITYLICSIIPSIGIKEMIIKMVICLFVPNIIFLLLFKNRLEFKTILHALKLKI